MTTIIDESRATRISPVRRVVRSKWFGVSARTLGGLLVLTAVILRVGTAPFVHGLMSLDGPSVGAALVLGAVATGAAAWRWKLIAERLGVGLRWSTAVGMYYRSQFLNTVLPGGVIGDVDRAVTHGRRTQSVAPASRAVVIERGVGQLVQICVALMVFALVGAEFEGYLLGSLAIGAAVIVVAAIITVAASARIRRALRHEVDELRVALGSAANVARVAIASIVVVACHAATFAVATRAVGANVPPLRMLALALVVLLAASIPLNIGGWGPREGAAGWAFAVAGFGASAGVSASTLFGILSIIVVAPGAIATVVIAASHRQLEKSL